MRLYYLLLVFVYWLVEFSRDLLLLLILPFQLVLLTWQVPVTDVFIHGRELVAERLGRFKQYALVVRFDLKNGQPEFKFLPYDDLLRETETRLNSTKSESIRSLISRALTEGEKYLSVSLSVDDSGRKEVEFYFGTGTYILNFPLTEQTLNREYVNQMIGLLRTYGFTKMPENQTTFRPKLYRIEENDQATYISAQCGRSRDLAIRLSCEVFRKVFQTKVRPRVSFT